jgi:hypothetical protein
MASVVMAVNPGTSIPSITRLQALDIPYVLSRT